MHRYINHVCSRPELPVDLLCTNVGIISGCKSWNHSDWLSGGRRSPNHVREVMMKAR